MPRQAPFEGRNKPHRSDRKWVNGWSPEQVSNRLPIDFPDDESPRISREAMLAHPPRENGYGLTLRTKNGPAPAGYGAITMANTLKKTVTDMPARLWPSLTWDRGKELSDHARFHH
ncbi:hypothetical protein [Burkholderia ubonensis]|uniref:hypothetical protein n=1 Tax=Burkholderia ubonensis TaxID=101571 RepID=UPI0039F6274F